MSNEESVAAGEEAASAASATEVPEPIATSTQVEVGLQRAVRYGPIIITATIAGAVIAALVSLLFPVAPDALYELGQIAGFMALIGAAIGLTLGAILTLILTVIAKRQRGSAIAVLTDVR